MRVVPSFLAAVRSLLLNFARLLAGWYTGRRAAHAGSHRPEMTVVRPELPAVQGKIELPVAGGLGAAGLTRIPGTNLWKGAVPVDQPGQDTTLTRYFLVGDETPAAGTVIAEGKGPAVKITKAPKDKAKVKGTVKVHGKASGAVRVELVVNGKVVASGRTPAYVLKVDTAKQKKTMKVRVRAYDRLGNVAHTAARGWHR